MSGPLISGDFLSLLARQQVAPLQVVATGAQAHATEGTTVFAFHFRDGILMAGDRRATAGNVIVTDTVEKVMEIDDWSVLAIAGSPGIALEMARVLQTSFEYYRRSQLQPLSLPAKVRALARLLKENLPMALQGVGVVMPLFAARESSLSEDPGRIFFYDPLGAQFQAVAFAASGSGSSTIRSILEYQCRFGNPKPGDMDRSQALSLALKLLETAASQDSATGGVNPSAGRFATVRFLTASGIDAAGPEDQLEAWEAADSVEKSQSMPVRKERSK